LLLLFFYQSEPYLSGEEELWCLRSRCAWQTDRDIYVVEVQRQIDILKLARIELRKTLLARYRWKPWTQNMSARKLTYSSGGTLKQTKFDWKVIKSRVHYHLFWNNLFKITTTTATSTGFIKTPPRYGDDYYCLAQSFKTQMAI